MSQWDFGMPPAGEAAGRSGEYGDYRNYYDYDGSGEVCPPVTYERDPYGQPPYGQPAFEPDAFEPDAREQTVPLPTAPRPGPGAGSRPGWLNLDGAGDSWPPRRPRRRRGRRRWLVPALAGAAAASIVAAMALASGPAGPARATRATRAAAPPRTVPPAPRTPAPPPGMRPPLTMAEARLVLAAYTAANNEANAQHSGTVLATVETGSSYAIDTGIYRVQRAQNATPYPAFGPERALYYIPRQPAAYPHWFAVQAFNANLASPRKIAGVEYLLFTQAAAGAPWKDAIEPYQVAGSSAPRIALDASGFATAVSGRAASLAVSPARIGQLTAASLDGSGPVGTPANLTDRLDQAFWRSKIPAATITDRHAPAPGGQVFGLATADGGALLFYNGAAELTLTPPRGDALHLSIPGFYSPGRALSRADIGYLEQFATYVPPRGGGSGPRVVADYSGIISGH